LLAVATAILNTEWILRCNRGQENNVFRVFCGLVALLNLLKRSFINYDHPQEERRAIKLN